MKRSAKICVAAAFALVASMSTAESGARARNAKLSNLPQERWIEVHRQRMSDTVVFRRQPHGGSALDVKRGRIVLFGSETHGLDWTNSPLYFDLETLTWSRAYPDDDPSTYRVTPEGIPIAGATEPHPWAMHTYAAVAYDALNDRLIVASYPAHLQPGRFTNALAHVWPKISRHPTWVLDFASGSWHALNTPATHFFAYATVYDAHRAVIVGYRADGIYELPMAQREPRWRRVAAASHRGYHTNAVFDSVRRRVIVAGSHPESAVIVFDPATGRDTVMPTPGVRPPRFQSAPLAFHARKGVVVLLAERSSPLETLTETWVYQPDMDEWSHLKSASLHFGVGMNFNMHYDPLHDALLLVTEGDDAVTSVWALRLR